VLASCAPITTTIAKALRIVLTHPLFAATARFPDKRIADALHSIDRFEKASEIEAAQSGRSRYSAGAQLIARAVSSVMRAAE
jgi:hypothetical protein